MPPIGVRTASFFAALILLFGLGAGYAVCGLRSKKKKDESVPAETDGDNVSTSTSEASDVSDGQVTSSESKPSLTTDCAPDGASIKDDELSQPAPNDLSIEELLLADDKEKLSAIDPSILIPELLEILTGKPDLDSKSRDLAMNICIENINLISSLGSSLDLPKRLVELVERHRTAEKIRCFVRALFTIEVDMEDRIKSLRPILNAAVKNKNDILPILIEAIRPMIDSEKWKDRAVGLIRFACSEATNGWHCEILESVVPFVDDEHVVVREAAHQVALESCLRTPYVHLSYVQRTIVLRVMEEAVRRLSAPSLPGNGRTLDLIIFLKSFYGNRHMVKDHRMRMKEIFVDSLLDSLKRILRKECTKLQANVLYLISESVKCVGKELIRENAEEILSLVSPHLAVIILDEKGCPCLINVLKAFDSAPFTTMIVELLVSFASARNDNKRTLFAVKKLREMGDSDGLIRSYAHTFAPYFDELSILMARDFGIFQYLFLTLLGVIKNLGTSAENLHYLKYWRLLAEANVEESEKDREGVTSEFIFCILEQLPNLVYYDGRPTDDTTTNEIIKKRKDKLKGFSVLDVESITQMLEVMLEEHIQSGMEMTELMKYYTYELIVRLFEKIGPRFCPYFARLAKIIFNGRIDLGLEGFSEISKYLIKLVPDFALLYKEYIENIFDKALSSDCYEAICNVAETIEFMAISHRYEWKDMAERSIGILFSTVHEKCEENKLTGSHGYYVYESLVNLAESKHIAIANPEVSTKLRSIFVKGLDLKFGRNFVFNRVEYCPSANEVKKRMRAIIAQMSADENLEQSISRN